MDIRLIRPRRIKNLYPTNRISIFLSLGSLLLSLESIDYKPTEDQEMVFEEEDEGLLLVEYS